MYILPTTYRLQSCMYKRLTHIMHDWRQFVDQSQRCTGKEQEVGEEEEKGEGGGRGRGGEQQ